VATGFCRETSDVDIALLCDVATYARISAGKPWPQGRPTEVQLGPQGLHYYAESFDAVLVRLETLDDACLYTYGTARVLRDPEALFERNVAPAIRRPGLRKERLEGKLDMLLRRTKALAGAAREQANALVLAKMSLEVVSLALKVIALLDDVPFDPRKRLVETALVGPLGRGMATDVAELIQTACQWPARGRVFLDHLTDLCRRLSQAANQAGFAVGLPAGDYRAQEQL
jgi:hypothetical protein